MSDKKNTLLIHIGAPKTGSTALQKFFAVNVGELLKVGWCYPEFDSMKCKYDDVYKNARYLFEGGQLVAYDSLIWQEQWDYIRSELERNNVIISAEEFFVIDTSDFLMKALREYSNIKVIVYLRRQDEIIESYWKHSVKTTFCMTRSIDNVRVDMPTLHYEEKLLQIEKIIGKDNLMVRVFEKAQFQGDAGNIFSDFMECIGINDISGYKDVGVINDGIFGNAIDIKMAMNESLKALEEPYKSMFNYKCTSWLLELGNNNVEEESVLSIEKRRDIMSIYEAGNQEVARKYLGRLDGKLFYKNEMYCEQRKVDNYSLIMDAMRIFGRIAVEQEKRINELYRLIDKKDLLINKKLYSMMKLENREIVLFGAGERCDYLLDKIDFDVKFIADNDVRKDGKDFRGIPIKLASNVDDWDKCYVIITCKESMTIEHQLETRGLKNGIDYIIMNEYFM